MSDRGSASLWLRWVGANALGEAIGLGATFAFGLALQTSLGEPQNALQALGMGLLMTFSGLPEGAVVGLAQWWVLRGPWPLLPRRSWLGATIAGALIAWALGSTPMTLAALSVPGPQAAGAEPPAWVVLPLAAGLGLVAGLILALPQWWVLRRLTARAWLWLPANAVAWALGMPLIFAAVDLAGRSGSGAAPAAIMAAAVLAAGAVVGAVHGVALVRLVKGKA